MTIGDTEQFASLLERARVAVDSTPGGLVTGAAGLMLAGCELPPSWQSEVVNGPIKLSQGANRCRATRAEAHRHLKQTSQWLVVCGVPIASVGDCLAQIAADRIPPGHRFPHGDRVAWDRLSPRGKASRLRAIIDGRNWPLADFTSGPDKAFLSLVMVCDSLMRRGSPKFTKDDLAASVKALGARPGVRAARLAVELSEPGTDSNPETWVRLVLRDCGLPRGVVNRPVRDASGKIVRYEDVGLDKYPVGIEYQGHHHFESPEQVYQDMVRREQLRGLGRITIEVGARDLRDQTRLVRRAALELARLEGVRLPPSLAQIP
ncbi:MAG: hypothetical protein LBD70_01395 [Bifidobacteriaceae bacterium]|jgi:hypothetical protein|nr:hypothetical protein [Bifidobacteriaceae bacterium]